MKTKISVLDTDGLLFLVDLLDCIINEIDNTILTSNNVEYVKVLDYSKIRLSLVFQRLNNYCVMNLKEV